MPIKIISIIWFLLMSSGVFATKVTLIIPDKEGPDFWRLVHQVSVASADSLGMQLDVVYGAQNRFINLDIIREIVARKDKPDYLIFRPYHGNAVKTFDLIEASGISFVTLEQAFSGHESTLLKRPKEKYQHWIGEVTFNNAKGGALLLDALLEEHQSRNPGIKPSIIGIGGDFDNLSITRQQVLNNLSARRSILLNQIFPSYWDPYNVRTSFGAMLKRYPQTNIFWCAGDQLAIETQHQYQLLSDKPIIIGGFDWLPSALVKIQQGKLTASVGGHFLMGAIAMVKVFDYEHGMDRFLSHPESYDFEVITQDNVDSYLKFMQKKKWKEVNFSQFSSFNSGKDVIPLTMEHIIGSRNTSEVQTNE